MFFARKKEHLEILRKGNFKLDTDHFTVIKLSPVSLEEIISFPRNKMSINL